MQASVLLVVNLQDEVVSPEAPRCGEDTRLQVSSVSRAQSVEHRGHTGSREGLDRRGASRGERTGRALEGRGRIGGLGEITPYPRQAL